MDLQKIVMGDGSPDLSSMTDKEKELLQKAPPSLIKAYGALDQPTLEGMIVGHLIGLPNTIKHDITGAQKIMDANVKADWFETDIIRNLFEAFMDRYIETRTLLNTDELLQICINQGMTVDKANLYVQEAFRCVGAHKSRKIRIELLLERFLNHHLQKEMDKIYQEAVKMRSDSTKGPQKAWEHMRTRCVRDLIDARGAPLKDHNFAKGVPSLLTWLKDMKHHPEQYKGFECGIDAVDLKTQGFRPGQLCVFVGPPGGYKTTMMINLGYGLWEKGFNVLYASLEMEAKNLMLKLLCRATKLSYSILYGGSISEIGEKGDQSDEFKIQKYYEYVDSRKNYFIVLNAGQSEKIKLSQLESWLYQQASLFKPDVVFLDYLSLLSPEVVNQDRLDVGYGDICKMSRAMGKNMNFSVVTAAQMKRSALDRLRKAGFDSPDKALFATDDIAESNMIGADADNAFVLWSKDKTELNIFTIKSRYGECNNQKPDVLQIDYDTCTIAGTNQIESASVINAKKTMADAFNSLGTIKTPNYAIIEGENEEDAISPAMPIGTTDMEESLSPDIPTELTDTKEDEDDV